MLTQKKREIQKKKETEKHINFDQIKDVYN